MKVGQCHNLCEEDDITSLSFCCEAVGFETRAIGREQLHSVKVFTTFPFQIK